MSLTLTFTEKGEVFMGYSSRDLKALSDLDAIRERSGMYIGEATNPAHLFQEAFDNALDESIGGHTNKIVVEVDTKTHTYTVIDYGRGIPLGTMKIDLMGTVVEKSSLEVLTSKTHSGGKFGGGGYKISSGLHGVGMCCMSALSEFFQVEVVRKHDTFNSWMKGTISYKEGKLVDQSNVPESKKTPSGTKVTLKGSTEIFESTEIPLSYIRNKCLVARAFGHKVDLIVDGKEVELPDGGLDSLITLDSKEVKLNEPIFLHCEDSKTGEFMEVCIQYTSDIKFHTKGFTNLLYNSSGGTHTRLAERAIRDAWLEVLPKDHILESMDVLLGAKSIVAVFIQETAFSSQTKERLTVNNRNLATMMKELTNSFVAYLKKSKEFREASIKRFTAYREAQNKILASKEIKGLVQVAEVQGGKVRRKSVVDSLAECSTTDVESTELFICEGMSAKGSLMVSRDPRYHGILPLTGKILNVAWKPIKDALKNQRILDIVNSIGCGVGSNSDSTKSRYGMVIIASDSDPDGKHINALVICALVNLVPDMVKAGKVYVAESALYGYYDKSGEFYPAYSKEEIPSDAVRWSRYKGLGEVNPNEMHAMFMDPSKRRLIRVEYPEDLASFNDLMAKSKKSLLLEEGVIVNQHLED